jgi:hypothetical protein
MGALAPERDRTLVVLSRDGELAVGLRERLERARVVVKDARPDEALTAVGSCRPWPWMLVGDAADLPPGVEAAPARHPVLVLWLGTAPCGLPVHARGPESSSRVDGSPAAPACRRWSPHTRQDSTFPW